MKKGAGQEAYGYFVTLCSKNILDIPVMLQKLLFGLHLLLYCHPHLDFFGFKSSDHLANAPLPPLVPVVNVGSCTHWQVSITELYV